MILLAFIPFLCVISCGKALTPMEFGADISVRAYDVICWYEKLKVFPNTDSKGFLQDCYGKAGNVIKQLKGDNMIKGYFGDRMNQYAMNGLPTEYGKACGELLKNPTAETNGEDQSTTLNIGNTDSYPFQAFANCLINQLIKNHGSGAIDAVKNEKTQEKLNWMATLLAQDNAFRARHKSPPLQLVKELTGQAQDWADKLASECKMYHSKSSDPGRISNGESTGESLSAGSGDVSKQTEAYLSSNGWYEEIKDYPFPGEFTGGALFSRIGHFTQTVWKESKFVGYGFANNPKCSGISWFVVARYFPAGNLVGTFKQNVLPPS